MQQFETRRFFGDGIYTDEININEAEMNQTNLLKNMIKFNNKSISKAKKDKDKKLNMFNSVSAFYEG